MKRIIIAALVVFAAVFLLLSDIPDAREVVITKYEEFRIDFVSVSPSPLEPGKASTINFEIINLKDEPVEDFQISFVEKFPFTVPSGNVTADLGTVEPDEPHKFSFDVLVNRDIEEGTYKMNLQFVSPERGETTSESFNVEVKRSGTDITTVTINVEDSNEADVSPIEPGETVKLNLVIDNTHDYTMDNVRVKLNLSGDVPFAPLKTTSEKTIPEIKSGSSGTAEFNIIASPDASAGVYKIPLTIEHFNDVGDKITKDDLIGLVIGSRPEIKAELRSNSIYESRGSGEVIINFVNSGLIDVKSFNVRLEDGEDYEILTPKDVYIGDVDADDDERLVTRIKLHGTEEFTIPITVTYRDFNNRQYEEKLSVTVPIYDQKYFVDEEDNTTRNFVIGGVLIFLFLVFYTFYRRWKREHPEGGMMTYISYLMEKILFRDKK